MPLAASSKIQFLIRNFPSLEFILIATVKVVKVLDMYWICTMKVVHCEGTRYDTKRNCFYYACLYCLPIDNIYCTLP